MSAKKTIIPLMTALFGVYALCASAVFGAGQFKLRGHNIQFEGKITTFANCIVITTIEQDDRAEINNLSSYLVKQIKIAAESWNIPPDIKIIENRIDKNGKPVNIIVLNGLYPSIADLPKEPLAYENFLYRLDAFDGDIASSIKAIGLHDEKVLILAKDPYFKLPTQLKAPATIDTLP